MPVVLSVCSAHFYLALSIASIGSLDEIRFGLLAGQKAVILPVLELCFFYSGNVEKSKGQNIDILRYDWSSATKRANSFGKMSLECIPTPIFALSKPNVCIGLSKLLIRD